MAAASQWIKVDSRGDDRIQERLQLRRGAEAAADLDQPFQRLAVFTSREGCIRVHK